MEDKMKKKFWEKSKILHFCKKKKVFEKGEKEKKN
jgi:hypothetical protein